MNSSTFSWADIGAAVQEPGNTPPPEPPVDTWKSEKSTRPHCAPAAAPTGVLNVNWRGMALLPLGFDEYTQRCAGVFVGKPFVSRRTCCTLIRPGWPTGEPPTSASHCENVMPLGNDVSRKAS